MTAAYRIDGQPASEEAFYAAACDPQRSVVVEACAGAGKTWMLVSRVLRALLEGTAPEHILAITFTRRAAAEMQQRLDAWLRDYADDASDAAQRTLALRQRGLDATRAAGLQAALGRLRRRLLQGERGVEIRTFHAWFAQLALQLPLQVRAQLALPAEFTLLEDPSPLHDELFRRLQRRIGADAALRADHEALVLEHRRSRVQAWLDAAWQRGEELELADRAGVLEHSVPDASALDPGLAGGIHPLQRLASADAAARWQALVAELGARSGTKAQQAADGLAGALEAWRAGDRQAAFDRAWAALFTQAGTPRKAVGSGAAWTAVVDELQALQPLLAQARAHDDHRRLVRLARVLRAEYAQLKRERRLVDMGDLERAAHALLTDAQAAGWVEQRLDQRVRQVLIDEFQDTSPLQWHALFGWLSAYAGAGGGASERQPPALFIVGDPKQSIYRFRRAEPRVFAAARDFVVQGLGGQVLACDHTRRNAPAIVAALNQVFGDAASTDGWVPFRAHTTDSDADGRCLALPEVPRPPRADTLPAERMHWRDSLTEPRLEAEEHAKVAEARRVARHVAACLRSGDVAPQQVMVLARQRAMLRRVADALAEVDVPCVMPEPLALDESPEAQDLVAVLDVLASPGHDLSLARALKSPLFGCDDADLLAVARRARACGQAWLDALPSAAETSPALQRAALLLAGWRAALADHTPHELLDRIVHEGDLADRLMAAVPAARRPQARQVLRGLLKAALDHDGGRFVSTYAWVRAVRQGLLKVPAGEPKAAVRLLTVHGAKGLEADAVFLVDTQPEPRRAETATLLVDWPVEAAAPRCAAFVASESALQPALQPLLERERDERLREEINALYVAMTRARRQLVVSCTEPFRRGDARSWWQRLQPALQPADDGAVAAAAAPAEPPPAEVERLPLAPAAAHAVAAVDAPRDARAAALGRAVHRLLEWMGRPDRPLPRAQRLDAARQAVSAQGLPATDAAEAARVAAVIVDGADCAPFFGGPALRWAGNEVPLALDGQVLRVDRLVRLDDGGGPVWWVLDYKLHHRPQELEALREQLARYVASVRAALQAAGQGAEPVRAGFITGAGAWVPL